MHWLDLRYMNCQNTKSEGEAYWLRLLIHKVVSLFLPKCPLRWSINGDYGEAIECLARYMIRAPLSVERIHYHAKEHAVTVDGGKFLAGSRNWQVHEFFALLVAYIPCCYESLITYCGYYISGHRAKLKCENREERIWKIVVGAMQVISTTQLPSSWAKWIRKIYETDLLICSECG